MKRWLILAWLAAAPAMTLEAADPVLARLQAQSSAYQENFSNPTRAALGHLQVTARDSFLALPPGQKKDALMSLAAAWVQALQEAGPAAAPVLLEVRWDHGGWLWLARTREGGGVQKVALLDRWDETGPAPLAAAASGRWFFFLGGQSVSGGDLGSSSGVNVRLGTTLLKDRYDLSFLFNRTSTGPSPKTKATALGVVGRMLFRLPGPLGYNVGAQIVTIRATDAEDDKQASLVAGLNYYQSRGAWDLSLALGDEGDRTLVIGYSFYLTRRDQGSAGSSKRENR
jgi:hypothetical protein